MTELKRVKLRPPYLVLIGEENDPTYAKTGYGIVQWCPEQVAGQFRFPGCALDLGVPDLTIAQAAQAGIGSLVIGVAPVGGVIPDHWWQVIEDGIDAGLDIVCGLHVKLNDNPRLVAAAEKSGARLVDVRVPPAGLPVGTGIRRRGKRILTVGTDCAVGKKFTALALHRAMREEGMNTTFRATGQTGIMIAGEGIPIDAVTADFISGAAELLSPDNDDDHWDVIEGQGSVFHPGYSGVSLGLLHGSQPDGLVVCHDPARTTVSGWENYPTPTIQACIDLNLQMGRRTNPGVRCVGISINSSALSAGERADYLQSIADETGLPCLDPLIEGCSALVASIRQL
jgi:uncharacterized NAD-dependent epimerase/dehydratase family protein